MHDNPRTDGHYIKIGELKIPCGTPVGLFILPPLRQPDLPKEHTCHGCILLDQNNEKPFCFLPKCARKDYEQKMHRKEVDCND